ncbi:hypothetical protein OF83DRAFT_1171950 [Amylostereum chailletii]|nr:hypothetical protein OF83DRAFT_1171950 [Amylostereum chailletii]
MSHTPSSASSTESFEDDDIEMSRLEEIAVTPNPDLRNGRRFVENMEEDEDSDSAFDEGERALLNSDNGREWGPKRHREEVSKWAQARGIVAETLPTLLLTTLGLMFTGELLDKVTHSNAMLDVNELIMIIPVMLNLKGNLEMNLSARLGTAANMGDLDAPSTRTAIVLGNLALLQVQAALVSFVASCFSFILGLIVPGAAEEPPASTPELIGRLAVHPTPRYGAARPVRPPTGHLQSGFREFVTVASSAMSATCLSALLLGTFMCALVVLCRKLGRDPDNIAPPVAACLGDLVTLALFGLVSNVLIGVARTPLPIVVILVLVLSAVGCAIVTRRNAHISHLLTEGWLPLFGAMVITSASGIVLDVFVSRYEGYAQLAIAIGGLPGGTGSILVSRLSTSLHAAASTVTHMHPTDSEMTLFPPRSHGPSPRLVMLTLFLVAIPVEIVFLSTSWALGWLQTPFVFAALALIFLCLAIAISLLVARVLTTFLWTRKLDPDMYALPIHSALMDLVGQVLLVSCFEFAGLIGIHLRANAS